MPAPDKQENTFAAGILLGVVLALGYLQLLRACDNFDQNVR